MDIPSFETEEVLEAKEDDFDVPEGGIKTDIVLGDLFEIKSGIYCPKCKKNHYL